MAFRIRFFAMAATVVGAALASTPVLAQSTPPGAPAAAGSADAGNAAPIAPRSPTPAPGVVDTTAPPASARKGTALEARYDHGFVLASPDRAFVLQIGGYLQADGRFFVADAKDELSHTFVIRRARPVIEGTAFRYFELKLMPDFGGGKAVVQDAYLDVHFVDWLRLRAGKMKGPFGLERLESARALTFVERSLTTNLVPNRDIGAELHGVIANGTVDYDLGLFDGVPDRSSTEGDVGDDKDVVARVFLRPLRATHLEALHEIGVGFAASWGQRSGKSVDATETPKLVTAGQATFFAYRTGATLAQTTLAAGPHWRVSPQGYAFVGPVGVLAEYVRSTQRLALGAAPATETLSSWELTGEVFVTGDHASYGPMRPRRPVGEGGIGALALAGRVSELRAGDAAFASGLADRAKSALAARAWTAGARWVAAPSFEVLADFERTTFTGGDAKGNRPAENAILTRLQLVL